MSKSFKKNPAMDFWEGKPVGTLRREQYYRSARRKSKRAHTTPDRQKENRKLQDEY